MQRPQVVKPIPMESLMNRINRAYFNEVYKTGLKLVDQEQALEIALAATDSTTMARKVFVVRKYLNQTV